MVFQEERYENENWEKKRIFTSILFLTVSILFSSVLLEAVEFVFKDPQYSFQCLRSMG